MPESTIEATRAGERSRAVRGLLATPMLDIDVDRELFRLVARHAGWLADYFDATAGWALTVDPGAGFARLAKRDVQHEATRPLRRTRGSGTPFDRRRYQLLCLICAQLLRHPVTTIGLLAASVGADGSFDTGKYRDRTSFVDALRALTRWGVVRVTSGEIDAYADSEHANAVLTAHTARLHRLIVAATPPGSLPDGIGAEDAVAALAAEPRYASVTDDPDTATDEARNRWARHRLGRRILDGPVLYFDDVTEAERDYAHSLSGRRWLRERAREAGLELEERREGILPIDPDAIATDSRFPAAQGNAHQLALLLADRLVPAGVDRRRRLARLAPHELRRCVTELLARYPSWARGSREGDGPMQIAASAVDLLVHHGLARRDEDGTVEALPALARYRVAEPELRGDPTLFGGMDDD